MTKQKEQKIQLTEAELLRYENIKLKVAAAQRDLAELQRQEMELKVMIEQRTGIADLQQWRFDPRTGAGVPVERMTDGN